MAEAECKDRASRRKLNLSFSMADSLRWSEGHLSRSPSLETQDLQFFLILWLYKITSKNLIMRRMFSSRICTWPPVADRKTVQVEGLWISAQRQEFILVLKFHALQPDFSHSSADLVGPALSFSESSLAWVRLDALASPTLIPSVYVEPNAAVGNYLLWRILAGPISSVQPFLSASTLMEGVIFTDGFLTVLAPTRPEASRTAFTLEGQSLLCWADFSPSGQEVTPITWRQSAADCDDRTPSHGAPGSTTVLLLCDFVWCPQFTLVPPMSSKLD